MSAITHATRLFLLFFLLLPGLAQAEEANGAYVEYIELQPPFIANYGGPGPLKYLKAEVSIKVTSVESEVNIKFHMAPLRHELVMLLSRQTRDTVSTAAGREQVRQKAQEKLRQVMVGEFGETGYDMINDLLFTSFVTQE